MALADSTRGQPRMTLQSLRPRWRCTICGPARVLVFALTCSRRRGGRSPKLGASNMIITFLSGAALCLSEGVMLGFYESSHLCCSLSMLPHCQRMRAASSNSCVRALLLVDSCGCESASPRPQARKIWQCAAARSTAFLASAWLAQCALRDPPRSTGGMLCTPAHESMLAYTLWRGA